MKVAARKSKGSQFELSIWDSLKPVYPDILVTKQLGFVSQYDLISKEHKICIECKFHKKMSWNECVKIFEKLKKKSPPDYTCYLIYKTNFQPVLVMYRLTNNIIIVMEFVDTFMTPFIKHVGVKNGRAKYR